jgi:hypothetical protein
MLDGSHEKGRAVVDRNDWVYAALKQAYERRRCNYVIEQRERVT